jgi:hypothetical protein
MNIYKILLYELLLIFASVFIFRSLWMIYDKIEWLNTESGIVISLIIGIAITIIALVQLNKMVCKKDA